MPELTEREEILLLEVRVKNLEIALMGLVEEIEKNENLREMQRFAAEARSVLEGEFEE